MKIARFLIAALMFAPATAHAVPLVGEAAQTCAVGMAFTNPAVSAPAASAYNTCPSLELNNGMEHYVSARVEPGMAMQALDLFGKAYYIDNATQNALFVPARTAEEWDAFLATNPAHVSVTPACRPVVFNDSVTCGQSVSLGYDRLGRTTTPSEPIGTAGRKLTYQCANNTNGAQWVLASSNGAPCDTTGHASAASNDNFDRTAMVEAVQQGWAIERNFQ